MTNKFRETVDRRLEELKTSEDLRDQILYMAGTGDGWKSSGKELRRGIKGRKHSGMRPGLIFSLAVCLCLLCSVGVIAAVPQLREKFFHLISPEYEEFAPPVSAPASEKNEPAGSSVKDQGILVEVTKAVTDGKTMAMYIEIQDEQGRIEDTADIYDYFLSSFTFFNCQLIEFDENTNRAKFCLVASGGEGPENGIVDYHISSIVTGSKKYEDFRTDIGPASLLHGEVSGRYVWCGGGGGDKNMFAQLRRREDTHVLEAGEMNLLFRDDIDFVSISNVGYLDGYLHIQTKWAAGLDNHGDVYLLDAEGERVPYVNLYFEEQAGDDGSSDNKDKYIEYIYDLSGVDLADCSLNAFFVKSGEEVKGNWDMEFSVSSLDGQLMEVDGQGLAEKVEITPLGIYLYGTKLMGNDLKEIRIKGRDGADMTVVARYTESYEGKKNLLLLLESPLELKMLGSIVLNGTTLYEYSP